MTSKKKILIIDDSEYHVEIIGSQLLTHGYEVEKAYDGESGLEKVKEFSPDLILLDVMMPNLNGYEVSRILKDRDDSRFVPIILITALTDAHDKVKGLEAGADDFLVKPLNSIEMFGRIESLLRHRDLVQKQRNRDQYVAEISRLLDLEQLRREEETKRKWLYKEVIYSVTNGKLHILEREELAALRELEKELKAVRIQTPEDVPLVRREAETFAANLGFSQDRIYNLALCVSEAATNVLKHANYGVMKETTTEKFLRIWMEDTGPGIEYTYISKAALMRGYSTKPSLGYGFMIMLESLDSLYLCTDQQGTTLILEMNLEQGEEMDVDKFLLDWKDKEIG